MEIITRAEARAQGLAHYFTGKPCKHGHVEKRRTKDGQCLKCERESAARRRAANPEKSREADRRYYEANRKVVLDANRRWRAANPERAREISREADLRYREANPAKAAAWSGYSSAVRRGAAVWTDEEDHLFPLDMVNATVHFYAEAIRLTEETGIRHEVDHIIPICEGGMHRPENLQVLPWLENRKKGGRYFYRADADGNELDEDGEPYPDE